MSWTVSGRMYHEHSEYQRALAKQQSDYARDLVRNLTIPAAETRTTERQMAAVEARRAILERRRLQVEAQLSETRRDAAAHNAESKQQLAEMERSYAELTVNLQRSIAELSRDAIASDARLSAATSDLRQQISDQIAQDEQTEINELSRAEELMAEAKTIIGGISSERATHLGLDLTTALVTIDMASSTESKGLLTLARNALVEARMLATELRWREARLEEWRGAHQVEVVHRTNRSGA